MQTRWRLSWPRSATGFTPVWTLDFPRIVTPDAPNGLSTSVMVAVLLGDEEGFDTWANELLAWAARQIGEKDPLTAKPFDQVQPLPEMRDWVDTFVRLRGEMAVAKQFGDLDAAKDGLTRVLGRTHHHTGAGFGSWRLTAATFLRGWV